MTVKEQVTKLALDALATVADTPAELVALQQDLLAAASELRIAAAEAEARALACWPHQRGYQLALDGVGMFERGRRNTRHRWDNRAIGLDVVRAAADRIDHPADVVDQLLPPASIGYWRQDALDQLGVNWKPHRETTLGPPCIRLAH